MAETNEPRALSAALSAPAFTTRGAGLAMHVADRHVERWAPEAGANRVRSMRSLGFVDRLIAPWIETAAVDALPAPPMMRPGQSGAANLVLGGSAQAKVSAQRMASAAERAGRMKEDRKKPRH